LIFKTWSHQLGKQVLTAKLDKEFIFLAVSPNQKKKEGNQSPE